MLRPQIRYSSDQPNLSRDQQIEAAVTTENNGNFTQNGNSAKSAERVTVARSRQKAG